MKLVVVRHGQTDYNKNHICQGSIDVPLNENGKQQALIINNVLADTKIDVVVSSTMKRAHETAILIAPNHPIILDDRLVERRLGNYEGKSNMNLVFDKYEDYYLNCSDDGVENIQSVYQRINDVIMELKAKYNDKTVLLVTHGSVSNVMYYYVNGIPENGICSFRYLDNGQYMELEI